MKKVLYAEDEEINRELISLMLKRRGMVCDMAPDGFTALAMFHAAEYGVIVLDQYMPGLNGDEVARKIRNFDPLIPLIAITSDESQVDKLNQAGFTHVFLKPLSTEDLIATIARYAL